MGLLKTFGRMPVLCTVHLGICRSHVEKIPEWEGGQREGNTTGVTITQCRCDIEYDSFPLFVTPPYVNSEIN